MSPPAPATRHGKVVRWLSRLTDDQVHELVACIDRQMAKTGMEAAPIREALLQFATHMPGAAPAHSEAAR